MKSGLCRHFLLLVKFLLKCFGLQGKLGLSIVAISKSIKTKGRQELIKIKSAVVHEKLGIEVERNGINSSIRPFLWLQSKFKKVKSWVDFFLFFQTQWLHLTLQLPSSDYKAEIGLDSSMIKVKSDVKTSYKQSISRRL